MEIEPKSVDLNRPPKLTIAVGVYNDAKFLRGGLEALLAQTYTDFELVISDNASTDETAQIIQEFAQKGQPNPGFSSAPKCWFNSQLQFPAPSGAR